MYGVHPCMYVCMYVCFRVFVHLRACLFVDVCMYRIVVYRVVMCRGVSHSMRACMYVCMYACVYVGMYACMHACDVM